MRLRTVSARADQPSDVGVFVNVRPGACKGEEAFISTAGTVDLRLAWRSVPDQCSFAVDGEVCSTPSGALREVDDARFELGGGGCGAQLRVRGNEYRTWVSLCRIRYAEKARCRQHCNLHGRSGRGRRHKLVLPPGSVGWPGVVHLLFGASVCHSGNDLPVSSEGSIGKGDSELRVSVAVATYKRPGGLLVLLNSLERALKETSGVDVEVIVVDNDPGLSAVDACADFDAFEVNYTSEPTPGISAARNAAVKAAKHADFIVFVDDDERVAPEWLRELLLAQETTGADMVAGPVYRSLPEDVPTAVRESGLFEIPTRENRAVLSEAGTGNLLCRMSLFRTRPESEWFQISYGLSGGEDSELTRRFVRQGALLVFAAEATAWELVPAERANFQWLARRSRRTGAIDFRLAGGRPIIARPRGFVTGVARIVTAAPVLGWAWLTRRRVDAAAFRRFFRGIGFLEASVSAGFQEYGRGSTP